VEDWILVADNLGRHDVLQVAVHYVAVTTVHSGICKGYVTPTAVAKTHLVSGEAT
jgi:hypothetical protein